MKVFTLKKVLLVNGKDVHEMCAEELIQLIGEMEKQVEGLGEIMLKSTRIDEEIRNINKMIVKCGKILDAL